MVNKNDRNAAIELRAKNISSHAIAEPLRQTLRRYAHLCCCAGVHKKRATKLGFLDEVASQWLSQLAGQLSVSSVGGINAPALLRFLPYLPREPGDNLGHVLSSPLSEREFRAGTIYMLRRHEDLGFVKIGITYRIADDRFSYFTSSCGFVPTPLRQIRHVSYVRRLERIIHAELKSYRRECTTCSHRTDCGALHKEWFEVDEDLSLEVLEKWARWMTYADPYSVDGCLKTMWMDLHLEIRGCGQLPTSEKFTEALKAQQAREGRPSQLVLQYEHREEAVDHAGRNLSRDFRHHAIVDTF